MLPSHFCVRCPNGNASGYEWLFVSFMNGWEEYACACTCVCVCVSFANNRGANWQKMPAHVYFTIDVFVRRLLRYGRVRIIRIEFEVLFLSFFCIYLKLRANTCASNNRALPTCYNLFLIRFYLGFSFSIDCIPQMEQIKSNRWHLNLLTFFSEFQNCTSFNRL